MALTIQSGIPIVETRGRPPSEEHVALLTMAIGQSFDSSKSRESLYQIARTLGVKVRILSAGKGVWTVWKRSNPGQPRPIRKEKTDGKKVDKRSD